VISLNKTTTDTSNSRQFLMWAAKCTAVDSNVLWNTLNVNE